VPGARLLKHDEQTWRVEGDIDLSSVEALLSEVDALWQQGAQRVVDLGQVKRIDSAGVALMLEWLRQAKQRNVTLRYRNVPRQMLSIATVCGVHEMLPVESAPG